MSYGFIGAGNMARAIIGGMIASGIAAAEIYVTDADQQARNAVADEYGVRLGETNADVASAADVVILAVKPHVIPAVLKDEAMRDALEKRDPLLVSIAAGVSVETLSRLVPPRIHLVRVMPNVNAMVGAGMAAVCGNKVATGDDIATVIELFETVGQAIELEEKDFAAFTALAGSAPAYVFGFIEALARGGVKHGIPKALAVKIATQTLLGSATMVQQRAAAGLTPADLIDMVSSPGGTTVAGTVAMEAAGFSPAVVCAVDAVVDKDRELASEV
ncbi:MAG: pyrroline-5-carboxylate reductase [Bowdeniella nasicola]|nr:pyrroline-5-carboxylate reductase [Bowdeniella nasicola]